MVSLFSDVTGYNKDCRDVLQDFLSNPTSSSTFTEPTHAHSHMFIENKAEVRRVIYSVSELEGGH